jgi:hypothetical protein
LDFYIRGSGIVYFFIAAVLPGVWCYKAVIARLSPVIFEVVRPAVVFFLWNKSGI